MFISPLDFHLIRINIIVITFKFIFIEKTQFINKSNNIGKYLNFLDVPLQVTS